MWRLLCSGSSGWSLGGSGWSSGGLGRSSGGSGRSSGGSGCNSGWSPVDLACCPGGSGCCTDATVIALLINSFRSASPQQVVSIAASRFCPFEVQFSSPESGKILGFRGCTPPVNGWGARNPGCLFALALVDSLMYYVQLSSQLFSLLCL